MAKKTAKQLYTEFSEETQAYMQTVHKYLTAKFSTINAEWYGALYMLAQNYDMFIMCGRDIKEKGLMITNRFGTLDKNPLIKTQIDAQIQCVKLLQEFGLTPKAAARMAQNDNNADMEEFVKDLVNG